MGTAYEAIWHAIIVGPVLIFIALLELLITFTESFSHQLDRFAGQAPADEDPGIDESGMA